MRARAGRRAIAVRRGMRVFRFAVAWIMRAVRIPRDGAAGVAGEWCRGAEPRCRRVRTFQVRRTVSPR
ncbi:MAG: hypothetical protein AMXMBFR59_06190 [Rhodanobacteraceae bacterium]